MKKLKQSLLNLRVVNSQLQIMHAMLHRAHETTIVNDRETPFARTIRLALFEIREAKALRDIKQEYKRVTKQIKNEHRN